MSNRDRRSIENIMREPLTRTRLILNSKIRAAQEDSEAAPFTLDDLKTTLTTLRTSSDAYKKEVLNIIEAVETGKAPQAPRFDTPEMQLAWGGALAYLLLNPEQMKTWAKPLEPGQLKESDVWGQITTSRTAYQELLSHAHHVREILRDKDVKYSWGDPGSGFSYDRKKKAINIDLMQSMIVGFEHARADVNREIAYSLLSASYPQRMQELFKEMRPLLKKQQLAQNKDKKKKGPKLTPDEYKQVQMLSAEWELRHMMFASAEENVTGRFVANMAQDMNLLQDFSVSLNNTAVTFRGMGLRRLPAEDQASDDMRRYMNLCNTVQLSFFQNNSLFDNTDDGWFKVGIDPNLVRKTKTLQKRPDDKKLDDDGISHADFAHLRELCGGPKGLEHLQPKPHERLYGWDSLKGRITKADLERKAIIEQIWEEFGEDLIQRILKQKNDQLDKQLEEAKKKQQERQDQDGQDGDDGDDGQDGEEQDGEGQEGGKPQKGKKGQKGQKGKKQRGQPQGDMDDQDDDGDDADGDDQDGDDQDGQDQKGQKGKKDKKDKSGKDKKDKGDKGDKGEKGDEQDGEDGEGQDGDEQDGEKGDKKGKGKGKEGKLGEDDEETVPVDGAGDMKAAKGATEDPSDELSPDGEGDDADADGEGQDKDGDGQDADGEEGNGMTEEDIEKEISKQEAEEAAEKGEDGQDADGEDGEGGKPGKGKKGKPSRQAGHGEGKSLEELSKQDWTQYSQRIAELAGPISRVRKLFKSIQERQLQRKPTMSRTLDILPENGEIKDRFNMEAHRNLTIKKMTGQVEAKDLARFHVDQVKMVPTEIDIVIMIDGSGSMNGTPINAALQAAAIMFEAASGKDMKMNVYVGMWGNANPPMIIYPGADRVEIGKSMQAARSGLNSGTDFAPAVSKIAETIGDQRGKGGTLSGFTHVLVLSDGDMFDAAKSTEKIKTMFAYSDKVTFDTAIIGRPGTSMESMAKGIKGNKPYQEVGVTIGSDPEKIPMEIVGLLLEKVRKCGSFVAVPNAVKRRQMKKAHNKMGPK